MIVVGILTQDPRKTDLSLDFFRKAGKELGLKIEIIDPRTCDLLYPPQKMLPKVDILMPRIGTELTLSQMYVSIYTLEYFRQNSDIPIINSIEGTIISNDKFRQNQMVGGAGFEIPKTSLIATKDAIPLILKNFSFPIVIKRLFSYGGEGVALAESERSARSIIETLLGAGEPALIQEYLKVKENIDYRVMVVGDKVVGGFIRKARRGDFRANVAQGGTRRFFWPEKEFSQKAIEITQLIGLDIAAVDFLRYKNRYWFLEINPSPGVFGALKSNLIAKEILKYCQERIKQGY